ncbi:hypothetical protein ACJJTC_011105 [Scirpophaga incertulas]
MTIERKKAAISGDVFNEYETGTGKRHRPKDVAFAEPPHTMEIAQILISLLHAWGLDPDLDRVCEAKLGLLRPMVPVCFGVVSRHGHMAVQLPTRLSGWASAVDAAPDDPLLINTGLPHELMRQEKLTRLFTSKLHWELSTTLTTNHLLSIVALSNTLMSMSNASFVPEQEVARRMHRPSTRSSSSWAGDEEREEQLAAQQAHIKQGWSLLATLHCVLLPDKVVAAGAKHFKRPQVEMLARRWQHHCLEVREAAQALLLAELGRLGPKGRKALVDNWAQYLPLYTHTESINPHATPKEPVEKQEEEFEEEEEEIVRKPSSLAELKRKQTTAVVLLGVIGAEFGQDITSEGAAGNKRRRDNDSRKSSVVEGDHQFLYFTLFFTLFFFNYGQRMVSAANNLARLTALALTHLLLSPPCARLPAYTPLRRAAIDLLGRGFTVWEPYLDVSHVLLGERGEQPGETNRAGADAPAAVAAVRAPARLHAWLLEMCSDADKLVPSMTYGLPLTPQADSCRTARHALTLIATARPAAFITTMAREVARVAAAPPGSAPPAALHALHRGRAEVLRGIELLVERAHAEVGDLLVEVMDIILHCVDQSHLKSKGLNEVFPAICRYNQVSHCPATRRIADICYHIYTVARTAPAVGSHTGQLALYELRAGRCQSLAAHAGPSHLLSYLYCCPHRAGSGQPHGAAGAVRAARGPLPVAGRARGPVTFVIISILLPAPRRQWAATRGSWRCTSCARAAASRWPRTRARHICYHIYTVARTAPAVGSHTGQLALYELRAGRCQSLAAHAGPSHLLSYLYCCPHRAGSGQPHGAAGAVRAARGPLPVAGRARGPVTFVIISILLPAPRRQWAATRGSWRCTSCARAAASRWPRTRARHICYHIYTVARTAPAVGSHTGQLALYELRAGRCQSLAAHAGPSHLLSYLYCCPHRAGSGQPHGAAGAVRAARGPLPVAGRARGPVTFVIISILLPAPRRQWAATRGSWRCTSCARAAASRWPRTRARHICYHIYTVARTAPAVGSHTGQLALYELRAGRCQSLAAHAGPSHLLSYLYCCPHRAGSGQPHGAAGAVRAARGPLPVAGRARGPVTFVIISILLPAPRRQWAATRGSWRCTSCARAAASRWPRTRARHICYHIYTVARTAPAVGSHTGQLALYELRAGRCQSLAAHAGPSHLLSYLYCCPHRAGSGQPHGAAGAVRAARGPLPVAGRARGPVTFVIISILLPAPRRQWAATRGSWRCTSCARAAASRWPRTRARHICYHIYTVARTAPAVGSHTGQLALYELRAGRCQSLAAHAGPSHLLSYLYCCPHRAGSGQPHGAAGAVRAARGPLPVAGRARGPVTFVIISILLPAPRRQWAATRGSWRCTSCARAAASRWPRTRGPSPRAPSAPTAATSSPTPPPTTASPSGRPRPATVIMVVIVGGAGMFGLGAAQTRCVKCYSTAPMADVARLNPARLARLVWTNARTVTLMLADGSETRFNV